MFWCGLRKSDSDLVLFSKGMKKEQFLLFSKEGVECACLREMHTQRAENNVFCTFLLHTFVPNKAQPAYSAQSQSLCCHLLQSVSFCLG